MITIKNISKTTSIYEWNNQLNSGGDEILELAVRDKNAWGMETNQASRILLEWTADSTLYNSASLRLFAANVESTTEDAQITVECNPLVESWKQGNGKYFDNTQNRPGVTWASRMLNSYSWNYAQTADAGNTNGQTQSYSFDSTSPGPTYYTGSVSGSVSFSYPSNLSNKEADKWDLTADVTLVHGLLTSSANGESAISATRGAHYGVMLMHAAYAEAGDPTQTQNIGSKKFFSSETNTIYRPRLELKYDDFDWSISTNKIIGSENATVYYKGNSGKYDNRSTVRFRPVVRETFPTASYSETPLAETTKTFSTGSASYAIVDIITDEEIIGFDNIFTRVCADAEGMYFDVPLSGFPKGRVYRPVIKVSGRVSSTSLEYFDSKDHFEVV